MKETGNRRRMAAGALIGLFALALAGCSTKECRCYVVERWGNVVIKTTYTTPSTACSRLGYDTPHPVDSSFRLCTEIDEPEWDYGELVHYLWGEDPQ